MPQPTITHYFKKENKSVTQSTNTHYIKEEINIDWDETDNCYGEAFDEGQRENTAKEVLDKLSEPALQKYSITENASTMKIQPEFTEKCPRCGKNFKNKDHLHIHRRYCGKARDVQCAHCSYKTKYKSTLTGHFSKVHGNGKNIDQDEHDNAKKYCRICETCNQTSEAPTTQTQCEKCFNRLVYQCSKCSKIFKTRSLVTYHWSTRCGVKGYFNCTNCDFKSVWRSKIVQHMRLMHKSPNLCQEFENIQWTSLSNDVAKSESNANRCPKCTKTMTNTIKLAQHIRACGGQESAKKISVLSKNIKQVLNVDPELTLRKCSNCGKQFGHIYSLNDHIRHCKKKMEYMTKVTPNEDVEDVEMDQHSKSLISADKIYTRYIEMMVRYCSKCQEDSAVEEKNRRIGSKLSCSKCKATLLFKCTKCLKDHTEYKVIKHHLDTICNPQEEFKCTKCSFKSFSSKAIREHYISRHGTANFECKRCGSKFRRNYHLESHLQRCGVEPIFQCDHCTFNSKRKLYLKIHIFRSHMGPVVIDGPNVIKTSHLDPSGAMVHLKPYCPKCKNEQRISNRLKSCGNCKTKLCFQCKTCKNDYNVDDKSACNHVKAYLESIKFECKRCGRGSKLEIYLRAHEKYCGTKLPFTFKCRFCKYVSNRKATIKMHEKVMHLNEA